jgi:tetratricopeptide (TPR) repeat protein
MSKQSARNSVQAQKTPRNIRDCRPEPMDGPAIGRRIMFWSGAATLFFIVHAMTPLTYNLDDIKQSSLNILGSLLALLYVALAAMRVVPFPRRSVAIPIFGYMAINIVSAIFSDPVAKWVAWRYCLLQFSCLGLFLAFFAASAEKRLEEWSLKFYVIVAFSISFIGIVFSWHFGGLMMMILPDKYKNLSMLMRTMESATNKGDMLSVILNRDFFGSLLIPHIMLSVGAIFALRSPVWKAISGVAMLMGIYCLAKTISKDTYGAFVLAAGLFLFLYLCVAHLQVRYRRRIFAATGAILLIIALASLWNRDVFKNKIKSFGVSFESRAIIWSASIDVWKDSPRNLLIGCGPGGFRIYFPDHRRWDYFLHDIKHVTMYSHNLFLDTLCETGALGFVSFVGLLGVLYALNLKRSREGRPNSQVFAFSDGTNGHPTGHAVPSAESDAALDFRAIVSIAMIAGMTGLLANSFTSPNTRWPIGAVVLWSMLGMMAGMVQPKGAPLARTKSWTPIQRYLLSALLVATAVVTVYDMRQGVRYWRSSVAHNEGLKYIGGENSAGVLGLYQEEIQKTKQTLASARSSGERREIQDQIDALESEYRRNYFEAKKTFEDAIENDPGKITSRYKLANILFMGETGTPTPESEKAALEAYEDILNYWPEYAQMSYNLGMVNYQMGNYEKALPYIKHAADICMDPVVWKSYMQQLLAMGKTKEAASEMPRFVAAWDKVFDAAKAFPKDDLRYKQAQRYKQPVLELRAAVARIANDPDETIVATEASLATRPNDKATAMTLADSYSKAQRFADLKKLSEKFAELYPMDATWHFWLANACNGLDDMREAEHQALIAHKLDPKNPAFEYAMFQMYRTTTDTEQAKRWGEDFLKKSPDSPNNGEIEAYLKTAK